MAKQITKMDPATINKLRTAMNECLNRNLEKLGLSAVLGSASYNDSSFTMKLTVACVGEQSEGADDSEVKDLVKFKASLRSFAIYGMKESHFNAKFSFAGEDFLLRYMKPRASKNPVVALKINDGRLFKLPTRALNSIPGIKAL